MSSRIGIAWRRLIALVLVAAVALAALAALSRAAGCDDSWANPTSGNWSDASDWSTGQVPTQTQSVCISADGTYTVTLTGSVTVASLTVGGGGNGQTLAISANQTNGGATLTLDGDSSNSGTIELTDSDEGGASSEQSEILIATGATLTNSGTILSDPGPGSVGTRVINGSSADSGTLVNAAGGTITVNQDLQIDGNQDGVFTTSGDIDINAGEKLLVQSGGGSSGGIPPVYTPTFNIDGGTITDDGTFALGLSESGSWSGSGALNVNGGTINGGELEADTPDASFSGAGGGKFTFVGAASVASGTTLAGTIGAGDTVQVSAGSATGDAVVNVNSNVTNDGTLDLTDSDTTESQQLEDQILIGNDDTLTNDGTIISDAGTNGQGSRLITGYNPGSTLNNAADGTIEVNQDVQIDGNQEGLFETSGNITIASGEKLLADPAGGFIGGNPATDSAEMDIDGGTIDDDGTFDQGISEAGSRSSAALKVNGGTITGAGLTAVVGAYTDIAGSGVGASFSGTGSGTYTIIGGSCACGTTLAGTIGTSQKLVLSASNADGGVAAEVDSNVTNHGTIDLTDPDTSGSGQNARIEIGSGDTLTNDGTIVSDTGPAGIGTREIDGSLVNATSGTVDVRQPLTDGSSTGPTNNGTWIMEPDTTFTSSATWTQGSGGTLTTWVDPGESSAGEIEAPTSLAGTLDVKTVGAATSAAQYTLASGTVSGTFSTVNDVGPTYNVGYGASSVTLTNTNDTLAVGTTSLPDAEVGDSYSQTLQASGGTPGYTWSISQGSLPQGLSLNAGVISGTPTGSPGPTTFTIKVTNNSDTATQSLTIDVNPTTIAVTTSSLPSVQETASYNQTLAATGGVQPYTWSVSYGSLPSGLSLNSATGAITGTANGPPGTTRFTVQVSDDSSPALTATQPLSITVTATTLGVTTTSLPDAPYGAQYDETLTASGGVTPYTWSVTSGSLPAGLTLDQSTGEITGSPTGSAGTSDFTVHVSDSASPVDDATKDLSITVTGSALSITTNSLPGGQVGASYAQTVAATGGTTPYTWSVNQGSLPTGLTLNPSSGAISGTPTATGSSTFTVAVSDSSSPVEHASKQLSIAIAPPAIVITTSSLPDGDAGSAYSTQLAATGGTTPYTWSVSAGKLPAGLSLSASTGTIAGTPSGGGTTKFTVTVRDSNSPAQSASQALSVVVVPAYSLFEGVSCASASNCIAVGSAQQASPEATVPMAQGWNGTTWSVQAPLGPGAAFPISSFSSISCATSTACIAAGSKYTAPIAELWNGTAWSDLKPAGAPSTDVVSGFTGISCTGASSCMAVGEGSTSSQRDTPFAESWNGTKWTLLSPPAVSGALQTYLYGVSCSASNSCEATGYEIPSNGTPPATLAEKWNGSSWSIQTTPNPSGATESVLNGVSCTSSASCTAVGFYASATASPALIEHWNGSSWSIQAGPSGIELDAVSCASSTSCMATGTYVPPRTAAATAQWNGTSWSVQTTPSPSGAAESTLDSISCTSATACTAAGSYWTSGSGAELTLAERWNGSSWSLQSSPNVTEITSANGTAILSETVPSAGTVTATASSAGPTTAADIARALIVDRVTIKVKKAGRVKIKIAAKGKAAKALLKKRRKLAIEIALTFKPKHGKTTTTHLKLTLKLKKKHS